MRLAILVTVQVGSQNLLNDMYADPSRWTTAFQLYSSLTRQVYIIKVWSNKNVHFEIMLMSYLELRASDLQNSCLYPP
jgi:deoxyadenosine/deoxycytidine kinase